MSSSRDPRELLPQAGFVAPQYDSLCFAHLPGAITSLLTGSQVGRLPTSILPGGRDRYQTVILLLIDALGWRFIERHGDHCPFLRRALHESGSVKLTAQFPSTTAAHVTTIHTGQPVAESGVFEWQYYEPAYDAIIAPLLHSYGGDRERETLPSQPSPASLYPDRTLYHRLSDLGVRSYVFQHAMLTESSYSKIMFQGANLRPFRTLPEGLTNLAEVAATSAGQPTYLFLYFGGIDTTGHTYGPNSPQIDAEIDALLTQLERLLWQKVAGKVRNCLLMVTADHGLVEVDPATTVYLNREQRFAGLERLMRRNRRGQLLVPAGSPRDFFLYVHDEMLEQAQEWLAGELAGRAAVWRTQDLIDSGFFGPEPVSPAFRSRAGNLVILPYRNEAVWWYERGRFEQHYYGHHGGLTREEMEIPLLLLST